MIPYARLSPGRGFQPGQATLYYLQRLVSLPSPRRAVSRLLAALVNQDQHFTPARTLAAPYAEALDALRADGVAPLPPIAGAAQLQAMLDYFQGQPIVGPDGRSVALADLPEGTPAAPYDLETVVNCPGLLDVVNAPQVLQIAAAYIGCKPTLSSLGVRWSFPAAEGKAHFHSFHRDIDDWRFLKLFVYLTDVDEHCGPHCYVRTSHRRGFAWRAHYTQDAVKAAFGEDKLETVVGPRGATFIADTLGVHRANIPTRAPRLILQAQYSILPVFAFRYAPVPAETLAAAVDAYVNRLLVEPLRAPPRLSKPGGQAAAPSGKRASRARAKARIAAATAFGRAPNTAEGP